MWYGLKTYFVGGFLSLNEMTMVFFSLTSGLEFKPWEYICVLW